MRIPVMMLILAAFLLAACGTNTSSGDAATTVEQYLQAKVNSDADGISALICSDLESNIESEVASLLSVEARLEDPQCTDNGDGTVTCVGAIIATYGEEDRRLPLSNYNVVQEDGEWRWCGEGE